MNLENFEKGKKMLNDIKIEKENVDRIENCIAFYEHCSNDEVIFYAKNSNGGSNYITADRLDILAGLRMTLMRRQEVLKRLQSEFDNL